MRALLAALAIIALTGPAFAQAQPQAPNGKHGHEQKPDPERLRVDDKGYKASLSKVPDGKYDPWRAMR
jgi:hypothetical protein